jgi:hypothetical protein
MSTHNLYDFGPEYEALDTEYQELSLLHEAYKMIEDFPNRVHTFIRMMEVSNQMIEIRMKDLGID